MRLSQRLLLSIPVLLSCLLGSCSERSDSSGAAPPAVVTIYCSVDQEYAEALFADFSALRPDIVVRPLFDTESTKTTGLAERLRSEKSHPQADLFWSSEIFLTIRLADEGLFAPLDHSSLADWPLQFRHPDRLWYAFAGRFRAIAFMQGAPAPSSLLDLTQTAFAPLVIADPNFGTTRGHVASLFALWGPDRATRFLSDLKAAGVRLVAGNSQAVREVAEGRARYALTDSDDVWAFQRNGSPVTCVPAAFSADDPSTGTLVIPNSLARVARRPDSDASTALALFLLSRHTEQRLAESDSHNIPLIYTDISLPEPFRLPSPASSLLFTDVAGHMDAAIRTANEILLN